MPSIAIDLPQLGEDLEEDIRWGRFNPSVLHTRRQVCASLTAELQTCPYDGEVVKSKYRTDLVLRLIMSLRRWLLCYRRGNPVRWDEVQELYHLKHQLLEHIVRSPPDQRWCRWEAGIATDLPNALSVRLYFLGAPHWNMLVHWPNRCVSREAREAIMLAAGSWPPPCHIYEERE